MPINLNISMRDNFLEEYTLKLIQKEMIGLPWWRSD